MTSKNTATALDRLSRADALLRLRKKNRKKLAHELGYSEPHLGGVLAGTRVPSVELSALLVKAFGVTGWKFVIGESDVFVLDDRNDAVGGGK
ncbi:MAG: hypothetical protein JWM53_6419 [bacterium]|nr:hypothetical protein [bacterium]